MPLATPIAYMPKNRRFSGVRASGDAPCWAMTTQTARQPQPMGERGQRDCVQAPTVAHLEPLTRSRPTRLCRSAPGGRCTSATTACCDSNARHCPRNRVSSRAGSGAGRRRERSSAAPAKSLLLRRRRV
jgi:hypothetical protein